MAGSPAPTPAVPPAADAPGFDTALRGYERRQVDEFVARTGDEMTRLRAEVAEARRQQQAATEHAEATEAQLRTASRGGPRTVEDGFGLRVENVLRMAEKEAAEARSEAAGEAAATLERARNEAEAHRHEVEQTLAARGALLEQQAEQREADLQERERQLAEELVAAREQADGMREAATRDADRLRAESEAAAAETRRRAETAARHQQDRAAQEVARLNGLQSDVRTEMARLAEVLMAALPSDGAPPSDGALPSDAAPRSEGAGSGGPGSPAAGGPVSVPRPRPAEAGSRAR